MADEDEIVSEGHDAGLCIIPFFLHDDCLAYFFLFYFAFNLEFEGWFACRVNNPPPFNFHLRVCFFFSFPFWGVVGFGFFSYFLLAPSVVVVYSVAVRVPLRILLSLVIQLPSFLVEYWSDIEDQSDTEDGPAVLKKKRILRHGRERLAAMRDQFTVAKKR